MLGEASCYWIQARQDSNLQPPVLEPTPRNAVVGAFGDFQRLSFGPPTPALLDNAGVGTIPGTVERQLPVVGQPLSLTLDVINASRYYDA
jgi:hypothetical protein